MDGMATSVAQAAVVLLCLTHRFKESPSCRTGGSVVNYCRRTRHISVISVVMWLGCEQSEQQVWGSIFGWVMEIVP